MAGLFQYFRRMLHWVSAAFNSPEFLWLSGWLHVSLHKLLCVCLCSWWNLGDWRIWGWFSICLSWGFDEARLVIIPLCIFFFFVILHRLPNVLHSLSFTVFKSICIKKIKKNSIRHAMISLIMHTYVYMCLCLSQSDLTKIGNLFHFCQFFLKTPLHWYPVWNMPLSKYVEALEILLS